MTKEIRNYNSKGEYHGYIERYYSNGKLWVKRFYHNGIRIDYSEWYYSSEELEKVFYI